MRDYIHVNDLCRAHLMAADYLMQNGETTAINCGYGVGYTVREVIDTVEKKNFRFKSGFRYHAKKGR